MLLLSPFAFVKAQGIVFFEGNWNEALSKASTEGKNVFLDAYTTWCVPCKKMEKEVFTQQAAGDVFNSDFVNVRMDMEKGEGIELAQRYGIGAYPTLLFLDAEGKVLHRDAGFKSVEQLTGLAETTADPAKRIASWEARFNVGEKDPEFLYQYTMLLQGLYDKGYATIAREYLQTQQDWTVEKNMQFILKTSENPDTEMFQYVIKNRPLFEETFGKNKITQHIDGVVQNSLYNPNTGLSLEKGQEVIRLVYSEKADRLSLAYPMSYFRQRGNRDGYANAAVQYFKTYHDDAGEMSEAAWTFSEVVQDPVLLKQAVNWAKKAIKLDPYPEHWEALATLYFKLGDKKKALKAVRSGITLANKSGENTEGLHALEIKINSLK